MPFQSEKQRRYLHANHPEIAKRWEREYATGGISNHFRKRFFKGAQADTAQGHAMSPGTSASGGLRHSGNGGGGGGHHPTGPTAAELAAKAAAAAAAKKAADIKARRESLRAFKKDQKKKVKHLKNINKTKNWMWKGDELGKKFYKNVSFDDALKMEKKWGYNPKYTGKGAINIGKNPNIIDKGIGFGKYLTQALTSPGSNISGGTPLMRMGVMQPGAFSKGVLNLAGKTLGPISTAYTVGDLLAQRSEAMGEEADRISTLEGDDQTEAIEEYATKMYKPYAHGGILDINESEEIISDDGNDIELTDYNVAFDDPNDFSTGVKSLFRAKDGGTPQLAKKSKDGKRPGYQGPHGDGGWSPGVSHSGSPASTGSDRGPRDDPDRFGPVSKPQTVPEGINIHEDTGDEEEAYVIVGGQKVPQSVWGTSADPREKYDSEEQMLADTYAFNIPGQTKKHTYIIGKKKSAYEQALAAQKAKLKKMGKGKLIPALIAFVLSGFNPAAAMKSVSVSKLDMLNIVKNSLPVMKAKKEYMTALGNAKADYEELGMAKFHHAVDTEIQNIDQTLLDLTQTKDEDTKGDGGIELPPQLGGPSTQEMAREYDFMGWIRENQARKKAYDEKIESEKLEREENPIVSGTEMDIIALGNSGGLANLFRVKKQ
jgi:hypothetical protein